ncbi:hypothetical protein KC19_9G146000 [Ceratodon purpureus]|uniref:Uncharacterized protein n=1 Tax=Ceratodon purpureus TaxID=3225 RepID=A0A8T0GRY9_CERPU|nr:hypothetical protein KC19_9G146000 [Ceratodon purpureus]
MCLTPLGSLVLVVKFLLRASITGLDCSFFTYIFNLTVTDREGEFTSCLKLQVFRVIL